MSKVRVLVVDDSVVARKLISDALAQDPRCEVVGTAANGKIALQKITQCNPDVVTLDVEMPEMDGLETLEAIRKTHPKLPVIMFSALTERGAEGTLRALSLGATDYVTKPTASSALCALEHLRAELVPKVRGVGSASSSLRPPQQPITASVRRARAPVRGGNLGVELVAIGSSTGGPNALAEILPALSQLSVPVVITQHMPPLFTRMLADRLNGSCGLRVREAAGRETLAPGDVWVAPGAHHLVLRREGAVIKTALDEGPPENSCRPAVDVMLRSCVDVFGPGVLAVVLTGMGADGLRGCERVREAGGQIVVQDESTSVVWGMPGFVARAGMADAIVPLSEVAAEIMRRVGPKMRMLHAH